jgi:hypothetical protein
MATVTTLNLTVKNGYERAFIQWSAVHGATNYDLQVKDPHACTLRVYKSKATHVVVTDLNNQENYWVQVVANKTDGTTERSMDYLIKPRADLPYFYLWVKCTGTPGKMRLQWTTIPTIVGYHIERWDIGHANKYITVGNIQDNNISTFEDQTPCDPTKLGCAGHQYKIFALDATWLPKGSKSSAKVFCMQEAKINNPALSTTSSLSGATTTIQMYIDGLISQWARLFAMDDTTRSFPDTNSNKKQSVTNITTALPPQITVSK